MPKVILTQSSPGSRPTRLPGEGVRKTTDRREAGPHQPTHFAEEAVAAFAPTRIHMALVAGQWFSAP